MHRMKKSSASMSFPDYDGAELQKMIEELVRVESNWIPNHEGYSLYIRPTAISMQDTLGVSRALKTRIFCVCSPVGPYYPTGFKPVKLYTDPKLIRAAPHGNG